MLLGKVGDLSFVALLFLFRPAFYPVPELQGAQVHASGRRSTRHAPCTGRPLMRAISFRYGNVPLQMQKGFGSMFWVGWKLTRDLPMQTRPCRLRQRSRGPHKPQSAGLVAKPEK
eukprot:2951705-Rhodomonas_salina.1